MKAPRRSNGFGEMVRGVGTFTLGATVGSLAALFCAPASGPALRRRLGREWRGWQRKALRQLHSTQRMLAQQADRLRETAAAKVDGVLLHRRAA